MVLAIRRPAAPSSSPCAIEDEQAGCRSRGRQHQTLEVEPNHSGRPRRGVLRDPWQLFLDAVLAVTVIVEGVRLLSADSTSAVALVVLLIGLTAGIGRRHAPAVALAMSALVAVLLPMDTGQHIAGWSLLEISLASYASQKPRIQAMVATAGVGLLLFAQSLFDLNASIIDPPTLALMWWTAAAGGIGSAVRYQRHYLLAHRERSVSLSRTRKADVARLIAEERLRIARELHDVLAHHIAAISVHASSAEANTRTDPDTAVESLVLIRTASGEVISELQAILHVLRSGRPVLEETPVAGSAQIPRLLESFRVLGLTVHFHAEGSLPRPITPALDLALFRIVQESLTNAQKYGDGAVWIDMRNGEDIKLTIRNLAAAPRQSKSSSPTPHKGFGLLGMRERAESAGGKVSTAAKDGWFIVEATFPRGATR